jgi:hypothetical protein
VNFLPKEAFVAVGFCALSSSWSWSTLASRLLIVARRCSSLTSKLWIVERSCLTVSFGIDALVLAIAHGEVASPPKGSLQRDWPVLKLLIELKLLIKLKMGKW